MMRIVTLALKDLAQIARDWKSAIILVLMPTLFTLFFGSAFKVSEADTRLPVGWLDGDPGRVLSGRLNSMLAESDSIRLVPLVEQDITRVDALVGMSYVAAVLLVPAGVSDRAGGNDPIPLTLIAPSTPTGQIVAAAVQRTLTRVLGSMQAARLSAEAVEAQEEQVVALLLIAMFLFAIVGGAWFPLQLAGEAFATVGHLLPTAWAMDGLKNIVPRGQGLSSTLLPSGMLLGYAAAFFGLALWRSKFDGPFSGRDYARR